MKLDKVTDDSALQSVGKLDNPAEYINAMAERLNGDLSNAVTTEFPPNLYSPMRYVLSSKGKRFRPIILLTACESVGGTTDDAYNAAIAIEILHNFTLVHDDIMDNDDLRRGRETVHKKWNESIAILAGDGLIALAYRYLLKSESARIQEIIKIFSEAIIQICEGQSIDKDMEQKSDVTSDEYLYMIERKTGVLMAISSEIGCMLGFGSDSQVKALRDYGMELGIAFQIQDDLLDIIAEESILGKDLGSDLALGKKTYPVLKLLEKADSQDRKMLDSVLGKEIKDPKRIARIVEMLHKYDVINETVYDVNRRLDKASDFLQSARQAIEISLLEHLSGMIRNRKF